MYTGILVHILYLQMGQGWVIGGQPNDDKIEFGNLAAKRLL